MADNTFKATDALDDDLQVVFSKPAGRQQVLVVGVFNHRTKVGGTVVFGEKQLDQLQDWFTRNYDMQE